MSFRKKMFRRNLRNYSLVLLYLILSFSLSGGLLFFSIWMNWLPAKHSLMDGRHFFYTILMQMTTFLILGFAFVKIFRLPTFSFMGRSYGKQNLFFYVKEFAVVVFYYFATMLVISFFVKVSGVEIKQFEQMNLEKIKQTSVYFLLAVAVLAPLYEEIVFRGIVLRNLLPRHSSKVKNFLAILVSSLVFSAFHFNLTTLIPILFLSFLLSYLTLRKQGLMLSILVHAFNNFMTAVVLLYDLKSM